MAENIAYFTGLLVLMVVSSQSRKFNGLLSDSISCPRSDNGYCGDCSEGTSSSFYWTKCCSKPLRYWSYCNVYCSNCGDECIRGDASKCGTGKKNKNPIKRSVVSDVLSSDVVPFEQAAHYVVLSDDTDQDGRVSFEEANLDLFKEKEQEDNQHLEDLDTDQDGFLIADEIDLSQD